MRTRSLRRVYAVSFGLSLLGHLVLVGAASRVSLHGPGTPDRLADQRRNWPQLLEFGSGGAPEAVVLDGPAASSPPTRPQRRVDPPADHPVTGAPYGPPVAEEGEGRASVSIGERMRGTRDARLSPRPHPPRADHRTVATERVRVAIEVSNDSLASAPRNFVYHLARGYHPDGRRILPVDGIAWQRYELFRQNERFVRDSIARESGRTSREARQAERTSPSPPR